MKLAQPTRLPDIFIVGAQKAGTTSLYHWLAQHPDISGMAHTKDLPFFADDKLFEQGIDQFARIFSGTTKQQYLMTGSVQYLFSLDALQRIRRYCPDAKILVMLREPLARTISAYRFAVQRGLESRSFDKAITDELSASELGKAYTSKVDRFQKFYVARSLYGEQLLRLYRLFPPQQVFVGLFSDMVNDSEEFLVRLLKFLNLPHAPMETRRNNPTMGMPRSQLVSKLIFHESLLGSRMVKALKRVMPLPVRYRMRRMVSALNTNKRHQPECAVSETIREQLKIIYRNDLDRLGTPEAKHWSQIWGLGSTSSLEDMPQ